ncbi:MAG: bifunctional tetrahydrofolate synthase/dihydrofolate synthase [Cycloclasticus sp.]
MLWKAQNRRTFKEFKFINKLHALSSLEDWLSWQETGHVKEIDLGLERVSSVWERLQTESQNPIYTITVAGTNGKGSSVALLESILLAEGYTVGVYSTPHLVSYNERIRLNGKSATNELITSAFSLINQARGTTSLSYFEFGTLAALSIFEQQHVDIQILEVGLGGRLDAVNIIDANAALVTSIDIDHVDWLGDDRSKIALEKAGVFRPNQKAVCSESTVPKSLLEYASELKTDLKVAGVDFKTDINQGDWALLMIEGSSVIYPNPALKGQHQIQNAAGVISLLGHISKELPVKQACIEYGLRHVFLAGRLQKIGMEPDVYLDVAHNPESAIALARFLKAQACVGSIHAVFSILLDKDVEEVVKPFIGLINHWYIAPLSSNRSQKVDVLNQLISTKLEQECLQYESIQKAFESAKRLATKEDLVICFGSFYVVEACLEAL